MPRHLCNQCHQAIDARLAADSHVNDAPVHIGSRRRRNQRLHDVIHVDEIARLPATAKNDERTAVQRLVQKARHDINHIIRNVLLLFEHELNNLDIEIDFDPIEPACELYVDDVQIQQVLVNLVKNSLDALVDADNDNGLIRIRLQRAGSEFLISVSDNGPGIDKELRKRLFEAFFTTKKKGVGLGLSICKSIATAHGGTLHYSRPREGGSRFTLSLPLEAIG